MSLRSRGSSQLKSTQRFTFATLIILLYFIGGHAQDQPSSPWATDVGSRYWVQPDIVYLEANNTQLKMLHLGAVIPNLSFAADAHYHHLADDIIEGGKFKYERGSIKVPDGPGLGVKLNREKVQQYSELYKRLGSYPYDQDPLRPEWAPTIPNNRWADPLDDRSADIKL
jgi:hypothetical protein